MGLCTLAAWLTDQGHEVRIFDLDLETKKLSGGQQIYQSLLTQAMRDFEPRLVGITSMYNNSLQAERMMRTVKESDPFALTVAGGSHFGALAQHALRRIAELDYAIQGEGEEAFSLLLAALESGEPVTNIPRLHYREQNELRANASRGLMDLSQLPPIWPTVETALDLKRYADTIAAGSSRRAIYIEAGRGCPFACTFCATAPFWERKYRVKPVQIIIEEIRYLYEQYGYNAFMLVHDLLTVDRKFINEFSDAMIESRLPVEWMANHRTDINLHGLLPKMKTAGCWAMFCGIESASFRLQKEMRKGLKRESVISTITDLSDLGITSTCSFVIGFPDETPEELSATINMGAELKLIGAGMVQFHRLRTWPPAPLSRSKLATAFDIDSLRIEYPFLNVLREDVVAIQADPEFFAGYFAPDSQAGTFAQLAQVELFFTHAVAIAPLTIAVLGRMMGDDFIPCFYRVLSRCDPVTRQEIEARSTNVLRMWLLLRPYLENWVEEPSVFENWQRELVTGIMVYEEHRLNFLNSEDQPIGRDMAAYGDNWEAFVSNVDIATVFEMMQMDQPLKSRLVKKCAVVLVRHETNSYGAYTTDVSRIEELRHTTHLFDRRL